MQPKHPVFIIQSDERLAGLGPKHKTVGSSLRADPSQREDLKILLAR